MIELLVVGIDQKGVVGEVSQVIVRRVVWVLRAARGTMSTNTAAVAVRCVSVLLSLGPISKANRSVYRWAYM